MTINTTKERIRFGQLPVPERADLFWGLKRAELENVTDGLLTALIIATPEFDEVIGPMLEAIDRRNRTVGKGNNMGRPSRFTSLQLESFLLYRRMAGLSDIKKTRERLFFDREAQELLGFTSELPSLKTMSRYLRERLDASQRADLYCEVDKRLRRRVMQLPGFDEECRILGMDGSRQGTKFTAPIPEIVNKKRTGKIVNGHIPQGEPGAVTAPTAGFVGGYHAKSGKGWQLLSLWSHHGTLLGWDISPLHEAETKAAERVLDSYEREVLPFREREEPSVLTADGAFNANRIREHLQEMLIVPNIHKASHKQVPNMPEEETENAEERNKNWLPFKYPGCPHYSNWEANGHGEPRCQCGEGKTKRVIATGKSLSLAIKCCCSTCGNITITSGQWRIAAKYNSYVRCSRGDAPDYALGNSLTFNDPISRAYGEDRFGWNESLHSTLKSRFGLLEDDSPMRDITEVRTEFAITGAAISVLLLERAARQNSEGTASQNASPGALSEDEALDLPVAA
jgi:PAS domain-containing protein